MYTILKKITRTKGVNKCKLCNTKALLFGTYIQRTRQDNKYLLEKHNLKSINLAYN